MMWLVDPRKITDYLLSASSPTGAPKNRFFRSVGFEPAAWSVLRDALARHPITAELAFIDPSSPYGEKRVYQCNITSPNGKNPCIRTVWQRAGSDFPLLTAYPFM